RPLDEPVRPLDEQTRDGVYVAYEHRRPQIPSLVAHLLKVAGAISFPPIVEGRHRSATAFRLSCVAFPPQVS
ncbi:MAG TPA: hypothetical protein VE267_19735, partial [Bradyrhizobium sp.]|nr:hypothetical protein [Bradyrhizobium sp.]